MPAAGEKLVIVRLRGVAGVAIRDLSNGSHPVTRCTFSTGEFFRFVSPTRLSYVVFAQIPQSGPQTGWYGAAGAMYTADLPTHATTLVRQWTQTSTLDWLYAWSPDGQTLAYLSLSADYRYKELHLLTATEDRTVARITPDALPYPACWPGFQSFGDSVSFSADGRYVVISTVQVYAEVHVVRVSDGQEVSTLLVDLRDSSHWPIPSYLRSFTSMWPVWLGSGARLIFQVAPTLPAALESWSANGGTATVESNVHWATPWASADGVHVVYSRFGSSSDPLAWATDWTPWIADFSSGAPVERQLSTNPRYGTAFLTPTLVWYAVPVPGSYNTCIVPGQGYLYDLSGNTETPSIITAVFDSWPHVVGES